MFGWLKKIWKGFFYDEEDLDDYLTTEVLEKFSLTVRLSSINVRNQDQRAKFIQSCCNQMVEMNNEIDRATMEYRLVTEYLTDMELLDRLSPDIRKSMKLSADRIVRLERETHNSSESLGKISEEVYNIMAVNEASVPQDIRQMKENEEYRELVRQDMQKLESEKAVSNFRSRELAVTIHNMKNMAVITIVFGILVMVLLSIMQIFFKMDATLGYIVAAALIAIAFTTEYLRYTKATHELRKTSRYLKAVIEQQNKVKIRYVNVTNVLDYEYRKYRVNVSDELSYFWDAYLEEKKAREYMERANSDIIAERTKLLRLLRGSKLKDPAIWLNQCIALTDPREMVEIRHNLIGRRQALRKRIEFNTENKNQTKEEINTLVRDYPEYGQEILDLVSTYDRS